MAKRILIVDDEPFIVDMLGVRLEAEGYEVLKAYDGESALKTAKESLPDLILLDIMMPPPDGLEVCRTLKGDPDYRHIKIIMLTARTSKIDEMEPTETCADGYMCKPYDGKELMDTIRRLIGDL